MKRAGLFANPGTAARAAAAAGLSELGLKVFPQVPGCFLRSQAERNLDVIVVCGLSGREADIARHYSEAGSLVILMELPHLRVDGQMRVSPPDHAWLPRFAGRPPLDRIEALGVQTGVRKRVKGQSILLVGQTSGDSSHGMDGASFRRWTSETLDALRALTDCKITFRSHPNDPWELPGADYNSNPAVETLAEALERCWAVVTYNSTAGLEALIAGFPVVAEGPSVYNKPGVTWRLNQFGKLCAPDPELLTDMLAAVAYTQWTGDEIATGGPLRTLIEDLELPGRSKPEPETGENGRERPGVALGLDHAGDYDAEASQEQEQASGGEIRGSSAEVEPPVPPQVEKTTTVKKSPKG